MTKYSLAEFKEWLTANNKWGTSAMHVYIHDLEGKPALWEAACQGKTTQENATDNDGFYILQSRYDFLLKWKAELDQREREREQFRGGKHA